MSVPEKHKLRRCPRKKHEDRVNLTPSASPPASSSNNNIDKSTIMSGNLQGGHRKIHFRGMLLMLGYRDSTEGDAYLGDAAELRKANASLGCC